MALFKKRIESKMDNYKRSGWPFSKSCQELPRPKSNRGNTHKVKTQLRASQLERSPRRLPAGHLLDIVWIKRLTGPVT